MTQVYVVDNLTDPSGQVRARSYVKARVVGSTTGEGAGFVPSVPATRQGWTDEAFVGDSSWVALTLDPVTADFAPENAVYQWVSHVHGRPDVVDFIAPPVPAITTSTAPVTASGTFVIPVASVAGFDAAAPSTPKVLAFGANVVRYTGISGSSFTGCTVIIGTAGVVASGTAVVQAFWWWDIIVNPPTGLPTRHTEDPTDAHDASAISLIQGDLAVPDNVQDALEDFGGTTIGKLSIVGGVPEVTLRSVWGITSGGSVYVDTAGATVGEEALLTLEDDGWIVRSP